MNNYTADQMFSFILEYTGVTEDSMILITRIWGLNEDVMLDVLYASTGYRNFNQMFQAEREEENYNG